MNRLYNFALASAVLLTTSIAYGALLWNVPQTLTQPDGAIVHCFASGDEFNHWLHDADNYTIVADPSTGYYVYARLVDDRLVPTGYIVGRSDPAAAGLARGVHVPAQVMNQRRQAMTSRPGVNPAHTPTAGSLNNIVIFIRFSNESEFTDQTSVYNNLFNNSTAGANSLYNYFSEVSYGQLGITTSFFPTPSGSTVVSYQDSHPRMYYKKYTVADSLGYKTDSALTVREHTLLANAVNGVKSQIPSGLNVDTDNDHYVDNVCFVVSGAAEGWSDLLWPHMWVLYSINVSINGARVWTYNFQLRDFTVSSGVGVLCHEMFHSLGSPDLYHYSYDGLTPVSKWDLMERDLNPPQHMGAWMKHRYGGWIASIPTISAPGTYTLSPLTSSTNNCYKIPSPTSPTEFFIVEYRKKSGTFENSIPGQGLLVYRIDSVYNGNAGGPPDEVYVYRPGGTLTVNGTPDSAAFSSNSGRTAISDGTSPSCFLSDGSGGGISISNVTTIGATISFTLGTAGPGVTMTARNVNATSATLGGSVNPAGQSTSWHFEYGTTTAYGTSTPATIIPGGSSTVPVEAAVNGLTPQTQYHARLVASNSSDTTNGADFVFWTTVPGWTHQLLSGTYAINSVRAVDSQSVWAAGVHGSVIRTTNGGEIWSAANATFPETGDIYAVAAASKDLAFVTTSGSTTYLYRTTNGGSSWSQVYSLAGGFLDAIHMFDATSGVAMGDPVGGKWVVLKTTNGGANWARMATEPVQSGTEAGWNNSMAVSGRNHIWFGTNSARIYRTTDGGSTWSWTATPQSNIFAIGFLDSLNGAAAGDGIVLRTTDGGASWSSATSPAGTAFTGGIGAAGSSDIWLTATTPASTIYRSTDAGSTWGTSLAMMSGYPVHLSSIASGGLAYGWVGTSVGGILRFTLPLSGSVGVAEGSSQLPQDYSLHQNYPNPFNPATVVSYELPSAGKVKLTVYDLLGREVAVLVDAVKPAGVYETRFDGSSLASGVYLCRLQAGSSVRSIRMLLLR